LFNDEAFEIVPIFFSIWADVMIRLINRPLWIPYMISFDSFDAKIIFIWKISIGNILRGYSFEI
jgi:hypothetical protein